MLIYFSVNLTKCVVCFPEIKDLIPIIGKCTAYDSLNLGMSHYTPDFHSKRLRGIALCPVDDGLFVSR